MEPSKKDWKLFTEKIPGWQERYMEKLINDYINYLNDDKPASTKFWEMEKRIRHDKKMPGVYMELRKGNMMLNLLRLMTDEVIVFDDLDGFSDELKENIRHLRQTVSQQTEEII